MGITEDIRISARPAEAKDRAVPGHWEGDLLLGGTGKGAVITLVERSSRFVCWLRCPGRHTAELARMSLAEMIATLPLSLRKSITWDRGNEMAQHAQFKTETGMPIYFCDPQSPWQRGTNENTNGLLRQYWPKGADLRDADPDRVRRRRPAAQHPTPEDPGLEDSRPSPQPKGSLQQPVESAPHSRPDWLSTFSNIPSILSVVDGSIQV